MLDYAEHFTRKMKIRFSKNMANFLRVSVAALYNT